MSELRSFVQQLPLIRIVLPNKQRERLTTTCFRNGGQPLAGNFFRWHTDAQLLGDKFILDELVSDAQEALASRHPYTTWSCEIDYPSYVGWASTIRLEDPSDDEMEPFRPNRWTQAWKMKDRQFPAPPTKTLTIVYSLEPPRSDGDTPAIVIHSMYPGNDIPLGTRNNPRDIEWYEAIFFDWENPGSVEEILEHYGGHEGFK